MSMSDGRVLVVDDDVPMCDLLRETLSRRQFDVRAVNTSAEAIECLKAHDYDALLTDLNMPGRNGIALCHEALAIRPGMPVVVLTAFGSLESGIAAIRAGAYDFLTKPADVAAARQPGSERLALPFHISLISLAGLALLTIALAALSGWYPARQAARVTIPEAIAHD